MALRPRSRSLIGRRSGPCVAALLTAFATIALFAFGSTASAGRNGASDRSLRTAQAMSRTEGRPFFDSREGAVAVQASDAVARARAEFARSLGTQGVLEVSPVTGTPRVVARLDGFLTGPSNARPADIALGYVRAHLTAFGLSPTDLAGLTLVKDYVDILGTHHLIWQQRYRGIPLFDNDLRAGVTKDGRLINVEGAPIHMPASLTTAPRISASSAVAAVLRNVGARVTNPGRVLSVQGAQHATSFVNGDAAALVLFGRPDGAALAWKVLTNVSSTEQYLSVVDALTGRVLWRTNMVKFDSPATGSAWDYYPGPSLPNNGGLPQHAVTFPVASDSALSGNNAHTFTDVSDDNTPDPGDEIPASAPTIWNFTVVTNTSTVSQFCSPAFPCTWDSAIPFSWQANLAQNATQVYYYLNHYHDHLLAPPIGFTEAAGNFQVVNSTGQGLGGDPVMANTDDGANTNKKHPGFPDGNHIDNANMSTPPDGQPPTMQMYLFFLPQAGWQASNGGDDASVVYHEYTHGLSSRLVTFADGDGALGSAQAGAMGEAWSDWYALDLLANEGFVVDGSGADVIVGQYVTSGQGGRFEPTDCLVGTIDPECPGGVDTGPGGFTYGDFGKVAGAPEVHSDGEIWAQTLWDIRRALGSAKAEMLVTRSMELSPPEPSFLDMRNAIIQADQVAFAGADANALWAAFAHRGMGFFASAIDGGDVHPVEDFSLPPTCPTNCGTVDGTITDPLTGDPIQGALVGFAGHMSGLASDLVATTDATGHYAIANVPFHDYTFVLKAGGYEPQAFGVTISGTQTIDVDMTRDWASLAGGAKLVGFTPPDYTPFGCGPSGALDGALGTGWVSDLPGIGGSGIKGPRAITVKLPEPVNVQTFAVVSGGACGFGPEFGVRDFSIQTKSGRGKWITAVVNSKKFAQGRFVAFSPSAGKKKVTMVRFVMTSNRGAPFYMSVLEVSVRGKPA